MNAICVVLGKFAQIMHVFRAQRAWNLLPRDYLRGSGERVIHVEQAARCLLTGTLAAVTFAQYPARWSRPVRTRTRR